MSEAGAPANGALIPEGPRVAAEPTVAPLLRIDQAGPGGGVPSDNAFGVALVSLWQRVAEAGGLVGFAPPVSRADIAARAAGLVDEVRTGRVIAVVANRSHRLIGAGLVRPGRGNALHTGHVELILVDPAQCRTGIGGRLMAELLRLAGERGLAKLDLDAADDPGLAAFFGRFRFEEWGRRPDWVHLGPDTLRDEIIWGVSL